MRNKFVELISAETENNPSIRLLTGDLGYGVLDDYAEKYHNNFLNCGIAEQSMIGIAGGLASKGNKVFVYSIANFPTFRCLEQIRNDLVYMKNNVVIVSVGAGFSYGAQGYTHHGIEDISIMRCLGDIEVFTPSDADELEFIFPKLISSSKTGYLRLGKGGESNVNTRSMEGFNFIRKLDSINGVASKNICIIACGPIAALLREISLNLKEVVNIDCFSVLKLDKVEIQNLLLNSTYDLVFTLEEHVISGGFGSFVNESVIQYSRNFQVINIGVEGNGSIKFGDQNFLRQINRLDVPSISELILKHL